MPRPIHGNANEFWSNSAKAGGGRGRLFTLGGRLLTLLPQLRVYCTATCSTVFVCMCSTVFVYLLNCICVFAQLYLCAQAAKSYKICIRGAAAATAAWWGFGQVFLLRGNLPLIRTLRSGFATLHPPSTPPLPSPTATCPFKSSSTTRPP